MLDYINLFSPNESEKNDLFKSFVLSVISIENFKISYILDNTSAFSIVCIKWCSNDKKIF